MPVTTFGSWLLPVAGPLFLQLLGAFLTQGKASSVPIVFSWGGNISPEGFLPSIMLLVVIIVTVAIMIVLVVVVVGGGVSSIIKLSFMIIGWANEFHQDKASSVKVPVANFTLQSSVQLLRRNTDSVHLNQRIRPTTPSVPLKLKDVEEDDRERARFLGGKISLGRKKFENKHCVVVTLDGV
ncbi:hypothetical protein Tco_1172698 [Tanacetum coccineum]